MSIRLMSMVWGLDLPDSEMLILLALADWSNDDGECWPSIASISKKTRKSERTIQGAIKSMAAAGHLTRDERPGKGCKYLLHPRTVCTPAASAPRKDSTPAATAPAQPTAPTPAAAADNTSGTIKIPSKASPSSGARERATRLPDDWKPSRFGDETAARGIVDSRGIDWAKRVLEQFRNHWRSANGPNARKRDWQAAWANWVIEQDNRDGRRPGTDGVGGNRGQSASGQGRTVDAAQRALARHGYAGPGPVS